MALPTQAIDDREPRQAPAAVSDAAEALTRARAGERVVIRGQDGVPVAAIVPLADLRRLESDDIRRERAVAAIRAVGAAFAHLDPDEVEREAVAAVREARAELYDERFGTGE